MNKINHIANLVKQKNDDALFAYQNEILAQPKMTIAETKTLVQDIIYPLMLRKNSISNGGWDNETKLFYWAKKQFDFLLFDSFLSERERLQENLQNAKTYDCSLKEYLNAYHYIDINPVSDDLEEVFQQIVNEKQLYAVELPFKIEDWCAVLSPFFEWHENKLQQKDTFWFLQICWSVVNYGNAVTRQAFLKWFALLEEKELVERHFANHISQAAECDSWFKTENLTAFNENNFYQWLEWLDSPNELLQAVSAKLIGWTYQPNIEANELNGEQFIALEEMLQIIYKKSVEGKQVAGGFINGVDYDYSNGLHSLSNHPTVAKHQIDIRNWVLRLAIDSPFDVDEYNPCAQAFWFYVHEFFDFDANAVHQLIDAKQYGLAMYCLNESLYYGSYPYMLSVIKRIIKEGPADLSQEMKTIEETYLKSIMKNSDPFLMIDIDPTPSVTENIHIKTPSWFGIKKVDSYYFHLAMADDKKLRCLEDVLAKVLAFWHEKVASMQNQDEIYLPYGLYDQGIDCFRVTKMEDYLLLDTGSTLKEGWSINLISPENFYNNVKDFKVGKDKTYGVKQCLFLESLKIQMKKFGVC